MVVERAEFVVKEGQETEFEAAMAEGVKLLGGAAGAKSVTLGRGIEAPSKFLLLIEWEEVESHTAFTKTPEFDSFRKLAGPFFAGAPAMEHFSFVFSGPFTG
jgi:heme-degrading monooxygenase HmoA